MNRILNLNFIFRVIRHFLIYINHKLFEYLSILHFLWSFSDIIFVRLGWWRWITELSINSRTAPLLNQLFGKRSIIYSQTNYCVDFYFNLRLTLLNSTTVLYSPWGLTAECLHDLSIFSLYYSKYLCENWMLKKSTGTRKRFLWVTMELLS